MPPTRGKKYAARDQEILDRFTTKKAYKDFLGGKKIKDFTPSEKSIYNRIAQQERRNPFGKELSGSSGFIPIGENPFGDTAVAPPDVPAEAEDYELSDEDDAALDDLFNEVAIQDLQREDREDLRKRLKSRRPKTAVRQVVFEGTDPLTLREQDAVDNPLQETVVETPSIPTVADLRSLLREAGALDRTPPQQHFTPLALSLPDYATNPELAPKDGLPIRDALNRRRERIAADEQARVINTERKLEQFNVDLRMDKEAGLKSSLISALGVIGDRSRKDLAEREYPRLIAQGASDAEARAAIAEGIVEVDREPKSISNTRRLEYDEYMSSQGGEYLKQLERFNIPTDQRALKEYKKLGRKAYLKTIPKQDWFENNTRMPDSPRQKRLDLQLGLDDPEEIFDPTQLSDDLYYNVDASLLSSDEDESFDTDEYIRQDVRETLLRDKRTGERDVLRFLNQPDDREDEIIQDIVEEDVPDLPPRVVSQEIFNPAREEPEEADFGEVDDIGFDFDPPPPTPTDAQERLAVAEAAREGAGFGGGAGLSSLRNLGVGMRPDDSLDGLSLEQQMDLMLSQRQAETTGVGRREGEAINQVAREERLRREALAPTLTYTPPLSEDELSLPPTPRPSEILTETTSLRQEQASVAQSVRTTINPWREGTREHARFSNNPTVNLTYPPNVFSQAQAIDQSGFGNYVLDTDLKRRQAQELAAQRASSVYIPPEEYVAPVDYAGLSVDNPIDLTSFVPLEIAQPQAPPKKPRIKINKREPFVKRSEIRRVEALLPEDRREVIDLTGFNEEPVIRSGADRVDTSGSKADSSGNVRKFKPAAGGRRGARKKKVVAKKAVSTEQTVRLPSGDQGFAGGGNDADPNADLVRQTGGRTF